jgi:hypothetical protein
MDDSVLQVQSHAHVRDKKHPYFSKRGKEAKRNSTPLHQHELVFPSCASTWNGYGHGHTACQYDSKSQRMN